ncbi:MAG: BMP family ABC transporter substrate-binding protein [Clostridiales bacterium]|nr:BMP family ABC transporter substrate-binding protein [Candidatus Cacconaster stercorequi]
MKKFLALILTLVMALSLVACGASNDADAEGGDGDAASIKIGYVYIGDENEGYTAAHMDGIHAAMEKLGISKDAIVEYTVIPEDETCYDKCCDLAEAGCNVIFTNSYGHQTYCAQAAAEYPEIQFVSMTGDFAAISGLDNFCNAFPHTYESRYVSGVVAGMKLAELIKDNKIPADGFDKDGNVKIGYVGAFPYAEVKSGYTAFYLGVKSIVENVVMDVQFTNSWFDQTKEGETAKFLMSRGCVIIGQHADSTGAPAAVQEAQNKEGKVAYSVGYNVDMLQVAPTAALTSSQNNWEAYYEYALSKVLAREKIDTNWSEGYAKDAVMISALGESCAEGTQAKVDEVIAGIKDGSVKVFDTANFTVGGKTLESAPVDLSYGSWDSNGNFNEIYHGDTVEAIVDGAFAESVFRSAPYFQLDIDGINLLTNEG